MKKNILLLILFFCFSLPNFAQKRKSRAILEKEKKENLIKIKQVSEILKKTKNQKQSSIGKIKALNLQIENQNTRISLANSEIELLDAEIANNIKTQSNIKSQLDVIQKEYAETLYRASKKSNQITKLGFLFSAGSFKDLLMRYKLLEQYSENRKTQVAKINSLATLLKTKHQELANKKNNKLSVVQDIAHQTKSLESLKQSQNLMVVELSKQEVTLKADLEKSKEAVSKLNNLISSIVNKSNEDAKNETNTNTDSKTSEVTTKPVENLSGKQFSSAKSRLSWPVVGFISDRFGIKPHPVLNGVKINNNGVDIQTSGNDGVSVVFDGVVKDISEIPGLNFVVAVQHGQYYTVYANLESVSININQSVAAHQKIGIAAKKDGVSEINFQIWHNFDKLNPENWLNQNNN